MHIPDDPLYTRSSISPRETWGFQAFNTPYGRIGVLICWDQWFPEGARLTPSAARASCLPDRRSDGTREKGGARPRRSTLHGKSSSAAIDPPNDVRPPP